jgi:predicted Zn-dependent peptidase
MRFLVVQRTQSPTLAFVSVVPVGGVNEVAGTTGIAHLLEHLLFKGTSRIGGVDPVAEQRLFQAMDSVHALLLLERGRRRPDPARLDGLRTEIEMLEDSARAFVVPNEFDRILSEAGARGLNATTGSEATTYYVELPANQAELWFALESQRISDPVFREFYTERDVVMEERRLRVEDSPPGLLYEEHLAAAFTVHPYGQPVVGTRSDLQTLTRPDVERYFRRYYGPSNTTVAVVGDISLDRVRELAEAYFSPLPPGESPPPVLSVEPGQRGPRRIEIRSETEPQLRMGWKVPAGHHPDAPALSVLSALLTGGRTSHLYRRLVLDEQVATFVSSGRGPGDRYPGLFSIDATPRAPHGPADVEESILLSIRDFVSSGPDREALLRVQNQVRAGAIRRLQGNLGLALQLASSQGVLGDWRATFQSADRIADVTAEEVVRVAREYLVPRSMTVAILRPDAADGAGEAGDEVGR